VVHLARLRARVVEDLPSEKIDRYLVRDAQRVIEAAVSADQGHDRNRNLISIKSSDFVAAITQKWLRLFIDAPRPG
jgi:hypothetical protein